MKLQTRICLVLMAALLVSAPVYAEVVTNVSVPVTIGVFVPCANGGAGEGVLLSGNLHILARVTVSESGNASIGIHFQPQGISGTGAVTGDKYQGTGVTLENININAPLPFSDTFVNNFRIIGQGNGNNFLVHSTFHVTVNANGEVTATVANFSVECK